MKTLLFSGGVESTCLAKLTAPDLLLTINYGQAPAEGECRASKNLANLLGIPHQIVQAPLGHLGAGEMVGAPSSHSRHAPEHWPFRNQMLITIAAMALADRGLSSLIIGTVSTDSVHNDGTPAFLSAMQETLIVQDPKLKLLAPALYMTADDLVATSGTDLTLLRHTFSCHRGAVACGRCRGCQKSLALFKRLEGSP